MKKYFKLTWLYFIIPIMTGVISGLIVAKTENVDFVSALQIILQKIWLFISNIITFKIPVWIILIVLAVIIIIIKIMISISNNNNKNELEKQRAKRVFRDYTEDNYDGIRYKWNWYESSNGVRMQNVHPICKCGCDMYYDMFESYLKCPDCKKEYKNNVDIDSAERAFANRYRKKLEEFKNCK